MKLGYAEYTYIHIITYHKISHHIIIDPVIHIYNDRFTNNDGMITFAEPGEVNANRLSPQHAGEMSWDLRWVPSGNQTWLAGKSPN